MLALCHIFSLGLPKEEVEILQMEMVRQSETDPFFFFGFTSELLERLKCWIHIKIDFLGLFLVMNLGCKAAMWNTYVCLIHVTFLYIC